MVEDRPYLSVDDLLTKKVLGPKTFLRESRIWLLYSKSLPLYLSSILIAAGLVAIRYHFIPRTQLKVGNVITEGKVSKESRRASEQIYFKLNDYQIIIKKYPNISYGDVVRVDGVANETGLIIYPKIEKITRVSSLQTFLYSQEKG